MRRGARKMPDDVLATFTIRDERGDRQAGYITTMFDKHGEIVIDPREAIEFVGFVQEGSATGKWIRFEAHEDDEWCRVKRH